MRARRAAIGVLLVLGLARHGAADPAGTLDRLVQALDRRLDAALVGHKPGRADLGLVLRRGVGASGQLGDVVRELLLGRLAARGLRSVSTLSGDGTFDQRRARARMAGLELVLDLEVVEVEGYLHLRGVLVSTESSLWRDTLQPEQGALHHVHARVRVDAEVRGYQGSVGGAGPSFSPRAFGLGRAPVLALGVGDTDGDGRNELAVLEPGRLRVLAFRDRARGFKEVLAVPLVPPWSKLRSRRPVGTLVVLDLDRDGRAELLLRTSEMEQGAVFGQKGKELGRTGGLAGYPLAAPRAGRKVERVLCQTLPGQDRFDTATLPRGVGVLPDAVLKTLPSAFYGLALASVARRRGQRVQHLGVVSDGGELRIAVGSAPGAVVMKGVGVALDLVDLDDDGAIEVATSDGADPSTGKDRILVHRLEPDTSAPRLLWRSSQLEGVVTALGHGDLDGDGKQELVGALLDSEGRSQLLVLN